MIDDVLIEPLPLPVAGFEALTYPRLRWALTGEDAPAERLQDVLALGARLHGASVGLVLLSPVSSEGVRRIWSIAVAPAQRRRTIGARLLARAEAEARDRGTRLLTAFHSSRMPNPAAFEGLLRRAGWSAPEPLEYRLAGRADWVFGALADWQPMLERLRARGFAATPWHEVTPEDRARAETLIAAAPQAPGIQVFVHEKYAEPPVSIALRRHGEIVGWVLGEREPGTGHFHYTKGYVVPELQRTGWMIGGLLEVCRRQAEAFGPDSVAVYETPAHNTPMIQFMQKRLSPRGPLWTDVRYRSEKQLQPAGVPNAGVGA